MYAKIKASKIITNNDMFMNDSAKMSEEAAQLVNAFEGKFKRVIVRSQSKDLVSKMLEVMDNAKVIKGSIMPGIMRMPTQISNSTGQGDDIKKIIDEINNSQMNINDCMELQSILTDEDSDI